MGHVALLWKRELPVGLWYGNPKEKGHLEKPSYRREENIRMDLQEVRYGSLDWIDLAQDKDKCKMGE